MTTITAQYAQTRFVSLLKQASQKKRSFVITKNREPAAILMSLADYDDFMEEQDAVFQKSLMKSAQEFKDGKGMTLAQFEASLKKRLRRK